MDREKVIKGIRKCLSHKPCSVNGCPYENECAVEHLNDPLLRDALALLKEQEAVKPEREHSGSGVTWWNVCGNCKTAINPNDKFCHECGRAVKWE
jgi:hypothetical protein